MWSSCLHRQPSSKCLFPSSPQIILKNQQRRRRERKKKLRDRGRLRGKKGAVQLWPWSNFFPFISPPPFLSPPSLSLFVSLTLPPASPSSLCICLSPLSWQWSEVWCQCSALSVKLSAFPKKTSATGAVISSICPHMHPHRALQITSQWDQTVRVTSEKKKELK